MAISGDRTSVDNKPAEVNHGPCGFGLCALLQRRIMAPHVDSPAMAISASDLSKRFDRFTALDRLNLAVRRGAIFGLLGPNGAGQSTAIKILTTLLDASSGHAAVAGFDVATQAVEVRRKIGYVPQLLSADGALTAIENLNLSARLHGIYGAQRSARVQEAQPFTGLQELAHRLVKTLSGGMVRSLADVFVYFSGAVIDQGGHARDVRESRAAVLGRG